MSPTPEPVTNTVQFIGTATTVLRLGRFTVLTDPNFLHKGQRAYLGKGLWSRRLTDPALTPAELPALDAVVLSHLHGDHFDRVARRELDRAVPVITTPHAAKRLHSWGFRCTSLRTWEGTELTRDGETLTVEAVPAVHARGLMGKLLPPVMGSVLTHRGADGQERRVYLSGDTLTGAHLDEVRSRHGSLDTAIVHLGGTRVLLHTVTMDADQGVDFLQRIAPRQAVAVHHSDYPVFRSPIEEFVRRVADASLPMAVHVPAPGETVPL